MSSIETSLCAAKSIRVNPVRFAAIDTGLVYAVQSVEITTHDGNCMRISIHLEDGCTCLQAGEAVSIPATLAAEDAE